MSFLLDFIVSIGMVSVIIMYVLSSFNYAIRAQKNQETKALVIEKRSGAKELLVKDFALAFDPTEQLKAFAKMTKEAKSKDQKQESEKAGSVDDGKEKKLPSALELTFQDEKHNSKIFKLKAQMAKQFSFVSTNSQTLPAYQPCRVTYLLDQVSGKHDASEVFYKLYRLETTDLSVAPTAKVVKSRGNVLFENVLEFFIQTFDHRPFATHDQKAKPGEKKSSLSEFLAHDLEAALQEQKKEPKAEGKESAGADKDSKDKNGQDKLLPQLYVLKLAYKDQKDGKVQTLELQINSVSACPRPKQEAKEKPKKEEDPDKSGKEDGPEKADKNKPAPKAKAEGKDVQAPGKEVAAAATAVADQAGGKA